MAFALVALAAITASALTMFSGFGLGTLLMPIFAIFVPVELAIVATAIVHGANNVLKASLLGKLADKQVVARFGLPAVAAALAGATALAALSGQAPLATYSALGRTAHITPLKLLMALLMTGFALLELHPRFERLAVDRKWLPLGGVLSGFFGGLSGHQGALRSAFLAKVKIDAEAFVGTNAVIGLFVDIARMSVYAALVTGGTALSAAQPRDKWLIAIGVLAAFAGVIAGKRLIKKVTMRLVQRLTGTMLLGIALLLGCGII